MSIVSRLKESHTGKFWLKYEQKIILTTSIILIAVISFEAGYLEGQKNKQDSIVVNKAACAPCPPNENKSPANSDSSHQITATTNQNQTNTENQKCAFVASKNSNKYHLASCQFAQKIKPENKICFPSAEEAVKSGYQGAKCCIK